MKLEVGQFARLKSGYICKIININDFRAPNMKYGVEASYLKDIMFIGDDDILKASHNIIDLIEPEDYVNGVEVIDKEFDNFNEEYLQCGVGDYVICTYEVKDIKSIVTKEQMEQMAYKVGE